MNHIILLKLFLLYKSKDLIVHSHIFAFLLHLQYLQLLDLRHVLDVSAATGTAGLPEEDDPDITGFESFRYDLLFNCLLP